MKKILFLLVILSCCALIMFCGCSSMINQSSSSSSSSSALSSSASQAKSSSTKTEAAVKKVPLRSFKALTLNGDVVTPEDFARYDVVAINVWSTTCAPCIKEMPDLARLQKSLPENILLCTLCDDGMQERNAIKSVVEQSGWEGITIIDYNGDLATMLSSLSNVPTTLFYDGAGNPVGEPLVGAASNVELTYKECFNKSLELLGKPKIA